MTSDPLVWTVAALQVLTALGIAAFWLTWFREPHTQAWLPRGYAEHERVFVFPDTILAVLLIVSAGLAVAGAGSAGSVGLVAAGMLLFLGVIDAAYFWQHGMFARDRGGLVNAGVVVAVLVMAALIIVVHH